MPTKKLRPVDVVSKAIDKAKTDRDSIELALQAHTPFKNFAKDVLSLVTFRKEIEQLGRSPFHYGVSSYVDRIEKELSQRNGYLELFDSIYFSPQEFSGLFCDPSYQIQQAEKIFSSVISEWKAGNIKKSFVDYIFSPGDDVPDQVKGHNAHIKRVREFAPRIMPIVEKYRSAHDRVERLVSDNREQIGQIGKLKRRIYSLEDELKESRRFERAHGKTLAITARAKSDTRARVDKMRQLVERTSNCPYCGLALGSNAHLDHIHPVSCGGLSVLDNLVWACDRCNGLKSDRTVMEFCELAKLDFLAVASRLKALGKRI